MSQSECDALVALYDATAAANWTTNTGWATDTDPCTWYGITCNATNLTELNLGGNQLSGSIPAELGNLTTLTDPYLSNNQLSGDITAPMSALRTNATISSMYLGTNGCFTVTDQTLAIWLEGLDPGWDASCPLLVP